MPRRRWPLVLIGSGVLALVLWLLVREPGEGPLCKGRRLSEWVEVFGQLQVGMLHVGAPIGGGEGIFSDAKEAVTEAGTNAFPYLLKWLQYQGPPLRRRLPDPLKKFIFDHRKLELRMISHGELREEGVRPAFRLLRTNVTPATIEELARLMNATNAPQIARKATCILLELAPAGLPPIVKVIENPRHPMRELAVSGIAVTAVTAASLGPAGEQLVPGLIQCLRDTTPDIPEDAARALGRLKMSPELTVPALVTSLQRLNSQLRASAAMSLAAFEADALPALPALTDLLGDADANVRLAATNAVRVLKTVALTNAPPH